MKQKVTHFLALFIVLFLSQLGGIVPAVIGQSLSCPNNIVTVSDPGLCSAMVDYADPIASSNCTTGSLGLGDIAFTGYLDDGRNKYSFVLLADIPTGTSIHFTDRGWKAEGGFRDGGETIATWTSTSALSAGTEVLIDNLVASTGTMSGEALQFTDQGDQIFAYKDTPPTAEDQSNFLAAIHMNGEWDQAASERTSTKPDVFTDGVNSIFIYPEKDNAVYDCSTTSGTPAELRAAINDQTNWISTNIPSNLDELPTCGFTVKCTASMRLTDGLVSGSNFPVGTTTVKYRATYGDGSTAECSFTVQVNSGDGLPLPWDNADIGSAGGSADKSCDGDEFTLSAVGPNSGSSDRHHFAYVEVCGDGEITAYVKSINGGGRAGIQMRESLAPGSRKIALKTRRSRTVFREYRLIEGRSQRTSSVRRSNNYWLRIKRTGNMFTAYTSRNGSSWRTAYRATVPMDDCLQVGLFAEGRSRTSLTTAVFDQVKVEGNANLALQVSDQLPLSQQEFKSIETPDATIPSIQTPDLPSRLDVKATTDWEVPSISVFPNPSSGTTNISFKNFADMPTQLLIRDQFGRQVKSIQLDLSKDAVETLELGDLPAGLYIVNVLQDGSLKSTEKLILK